MGKTKSGKGTKIMAVAAAMVLASRVANNFRRLVDPGGTGTTNKATLTKYCGERIAANHCGAGQTDRMSRWGGSDNPLSCRHAL